MSANTNHATDLPPRKRQRTYSVAESLRQRTTENKDFQDFLIKSLRSRIQDLEAQLSKSQVLTKERDETIAILNQVLNEANRVNDRLAAELVATRRMLFKRDATITAANEEATRLREEDPVIAEESKEACTLRNLPQKQQESLNEVAGSKQARPQASTTDVSRRADHEVTANSTLDITVKIADVELPIRSKH
jgi:hypothetical protein